MYTRVEPPQTPTLRFRFLARPPPPPRARSAALSVRAAQSLTGKVVSTKAASTVVVAVDRFPPHPLYAKRIR